MEITRRRALYASPLALFTVASSFSPPAAAKDGSALPDLLILGSPHLANSNRDVANVQVGDVTTPERQKELRQLLDALARYAPTRIAVEVRAKDQARLNQRYDAYRAGSYAPSANEVDQIAFPLAAKANLTAIDAIDWNDAPPMAEADYDYLAWARANGREAEVATFLKQVQAEAQDREARMRCTSVGQWYRDLNTPAYRAADNARYFEIAQFGEAGPNWLGGSWYMRNLKIFAQLRRIAKAGDRVLVLYGAGHGFLLEQFARQSRAFTLSDPLAYLPPEGPRSVCAPPP